MWLTPIRGDIYYVAKELARNLQHPTIEDLAKLKHVLRYLKGTKHYSQVLVPRMQLHAHAVAELHVYVDSDWAGCRTTRKSTSGCVVVLLGCTIHQYARTQGSIATSSGEAELYAIGSGVAEALGIVNFLQESQLMPKVTITIHTDSSSAKTIATRIGTSKLTKHIQLRFLYVQDLVATNIIKIRKVGTKFNYADVLTKIVPTSTLHYHLGNLGLDTGHYDIGDEDTRPLHLQSVKKTKSFQVCGIALHDARVVHDALHVRDLACAHELLDTSGDLQRVELLSCSGETQQHALHLCNSGALSAALGSTIQGKHMITIGLLESTTYPLTINKVFDDDTKVRGFNPISKKFDYMMKQQALHPMMKALTNQQAFKCHFSDKLRDNDWSLNRRDALIKKTKRLEDLQKTLWEVFPTTKMAATTTPDVEEFLTMAKLRPQGALEAGLSMSPDYSMEMEMVWQKYTTIQVLANDLFGEHLGLGKEEVPEML